MFFSQQLSHIQHQILFHAVESMVVRLVYTMPFSDRSCMEKPCLKALLPALPFRLSKLLGKVNETPTFALASQPCCLSGTWLTEHTSLPSWTSSDLHKAMWTWGSREMLNTATGKRPNPLFKGGRYVMLSNRGAAVRTDGFQALGAGCRFLSFSPYYLAASLI